MQGRGAYFCITALLRINTSKKVKTKTLQKTPTLSFQPVSRYKKTWQQARPLLSY